MAAKAGTVYWFTGLSGAGKTTTARAFEAVLKEQGMAVQLLDGDELRETINKGLGFSREDRMENIRRITYVANLLAQHGITVLVSAITPYAEMRVHARQQLPEFVEVYVECPLEECERRDVKGLYAKARRNEIAQFTGISDTYDVPVTPEITIHTGSRTLDENVQQLFEWHAHHSGKEAANLGFALQESADLDSAGHASSAAAQKAPNEQEA